MSYKKGNLMLDDDYMYDAREDDYQTDGVKAYLPHSCDQWVIGSVKEIDALIADLQEAKAELAATRSDNPEKEVEV